MDAFPNARRPRICVISYKALSRLVPEVIDEFAHRATIDVFDVVFDEALEKARQLERDGEADVIVSAGANATCLRSNISLPVVTINVGGFDVLQALRKAGSISSRVAMVTYREPIPELEAIKGLLRLEITQHTYNTIEDATYLVRALASDGYGVVVGSSLINELAEQNAMRGVLIYSVSAVRQAIEGAIEIARVSSLEAARFDQLNGVLHHLREAILAVGVDGKVIAINQAMARMLDLGATDAVGSDVRNLVPGIDLNQVLATGQAESEQVVQIGPITCVANRVPIQEQGRCTGAVLTLQDARTIQRSDLSIRSQRRSRQLAARYHFDHLLGSSPSFVAARRAAERYARTDATVLITGESGTGKELFAQAIHNASARRNGPFVAINCAAFPEQLLESELFGHEEGAFTGSRKGGKFGLFEAAHKGSIFLDEIGDMPVSLQSRLLRVLQEKEVTRLGSTQPIPVDVRVVAATHQALGDRIASGHFRSDLYYRLNILHLWLPPLRERPEDVAMLVLKLLYGALQRLGVSLPVDQAVAPVLPILRAYAWPGNVRELENIAERLAVFLSDYRMVNDIDYTGMRLEFPEIFAADGTPQGATPLGTAKRAIETPGDGAPETGDLAAALQASGGNRQIAAERLGISRTTLWRRMKNLPASRQPTVPE